MPYLTEDKAKTKECCVGIGYDCVGADCMGWRWRDDGHETAQVSMYWPEKEKAPPPSMPPDDGGEPWQVHSRGPVQSLPDGRRHRIDTFRRHLKRVGYCGRAGKPAG